MDMNSNLSTSQSIGVSMGNTSAVLSQTRKPLKLFFSNKVQTKS